MRPDLFMLVLFKKESESRTAQRGLAMKQAWGARVAHMPVIEPSIEANALFLAIPRNFGPIFDTFWAQKQPKNSRTRVRFSPPQNDQAPNPHHIEPFPKRTSPFGRHQKVVPGMSPAKIEMDALFWAITRIFRLFGPIFDTLWAKNSPKMCPQSCQNPSPGRHF